LRKVSRRYGSQVSVSIPRISQLIVVEAGIAYTVFDTETPGTSRPREWTLAVHWSIPILEKLLPVELFNRLSEAQCDPAHDRGADETIELRNSETGDILKIISTPGMKRVSRKKLRSLCGEGIDVLWGKTLDEVTYDVDGAGLTAHFADSSVYHGDLLLGADGPKSKVREILLGVEKSRNSSVEIVFNMIIVKYGDAKKAMHVRSAHPVNCLGYNPNGRFNMNASECLAFVMYIVDKILRKLSPGYPRSRETRDLVISTCYILAGQKRP
jgi:2-polyprenyl-6-methoxyphenol hydroxylase-like FAD-dependent oxidoreductase